MEVEIEKEKSPETPAEDQPQEPATPAQTEQSKEETKKTDGTNTSAKFIHCWSTWLYERCPCWYDCLA